MFQLAVEDTGLLAGIPWLLWFWVALVVVLAIVALLVGMLFGKGLPKVALLYALGAAAGFIFFFVMFGFTPLGPWFIARLDRASGPLFWELAVPVLLIFMLLLAIPGTIIMYICLWGTSSPRQPGTAKTKVLDVLGMLATGFFTAGLWGALLPLHFWQRVADEAMALA